MPTDSLETLRVKDTFGRLLQVPSPWASGSYAAVALGDGTSSALYLGGSTVKVGGPSGAATLEVYVSGAYRGVVSASGVGDATKFVRGDGTYQPISSIATTDASLLTSGTLADSRLSANVPLKDAANTFTASQTVGTAATSNIAVTLRGNERQLVLMDADGLAQTSLVQTGAGYYQSLYLYTTSFVVSAGVGGTTFLHPVQVNAGNAVFVPLTIKGAASQTADLTQWQDSAGTVGARVTAAMEFSNASILQSEKFGALASTQYQNSTAVGFNAAANNGAYTTAVGSNATAFNDNAIAFGAGASAPGHNSMALGTAATASSFYSIAIGSGCSVADAGGVGIYTGGNNPKLRLLRNSTTQQRPVWEAVGSWADSTDATRQGSVALGAYGIVGGSETLQTGLTVAAQSSGVAEVYVRSGISFQSATLGQNNWWKWFSYEDGPGNRLFSLTNNNSGYTPLVLNGTDSSTTINAGGGTVSAWFLRTTQIDRPDGIGSYLLCGANSVQAMGRTAGHCPLLVRPQSGHEGAVTLWLDGDNQTRAEVTALSDRSTLKLSFPSVSEYEIMLYADGNTYYDVGHPGVGHRFRLRGDVTSLIMGWAGNELYAASASSAPAVLINAAGQTTDTLRFGGPSTSGVRAQAAVNSSWADSTDATRRGSVAIGAYGIVGGTETLQVGLTVSGTATIYPKVTLPNNAHWRAATSGVGGNTENEAAAIGAEYAVADHPTRRGRMSFSVDRPFGMTEVFRLEASAGGGSGTFSIGNSEYLTVAVASSSFFAVQSINTGSAVLTVGNSSGTDVLGFFGTTPVAKPTFAADATDLASAITLVNDLKARLVAYGLGA